MLHLQDELDHILQSTNTRNLYNITQSNNPHFTTFTQKISNPHKSQKENQITLQPNISQKNKTARALSHGGTTTHSSQYLKQLKTERDINRKRSMSKLNKNNQPKEFFQNCTPTINVGLRKDSVFTFKPQDDSDTENNIPKNIKISPFSSTQTRQKSRRSSHQHHTQKNIQIQSHHKKQLDESPVAQRKSRNQSHIYQENPKMRVSLGNYLSLQRLHFNSINTLAASTEINLVPECYRKYQEIRQSRAQNAGKPKIIKDHKTINKIKKTSENTPHDETNNTATLIQTMKFIEGIQSELEHSMTKHTHHIHEPLHHQSEKTQKYYRNQHTGKEPIKSNNISVVTANSRLIFYALKIPPQLTIKWKLESNVLGIEQIQKQNEEYQLVQRMIGIINKIRSLYKSYNAYAYEKFMRAININTIGEKGELLYFSNCSEIITEIVTHDERFQDFFRENPNELILSPNLNIAKYYYSKSGKTNSKWRIILCITAIQKKWVEDLNFSVFMKEFEKKRTELLRRGYDCVYFKCNDFYLHLDPSLCLPIYIINYSFK